AIAEVAMHQRRLDRRVGQVVGQPPHGKLEYWAPVTMPAMPIDVECEFVPCIGVAQPRHLRGIDSVNGGQGRTTLPRQSLPGPGKAGIRHDLSPERLAL